MSASAWFVNLSIAVVLIVGGYQFYFLPQRRPLKDSAQFSTILDDKIQFTPQWVWIYSGLYYPVILSLILTIGSFEQFNLTAFNFLILLVVQLVFFFIFPVKTPPEWRDYEHDGSLSAKFLRFVHGYDAPSNCFPSMHVSVAMLTALHLSNNLEPTLGSWVAIFFLFPILIALSALFTKQHYFVDLPAGAMLGYLCFLVNDFLI